MERFVEVLKQPVEVFRKVGNEGLGNAWMYYTVFAVISGTINIVLSGMLFSKGAILALAYLLGYAIGAAIAPLLITIGIALPHWMAKLLGGKGRFKDLWKASLYAATPGFIGSALMSLPAIGGIVSVVSSIWSLALQIIALSEVHKISKGKAIAAYVLSAVVVILVMAAVIVIAGAAVMATLAGIMASSMKAGAMAANATA